MALPGLLGARLGRLFAEILRPLCQPPLGLPSASLQSVQWRDSEGRGQNQGTRLTSPGPRHASWASEFWASIWNRGPPRQSTGPNMPQHLTFYLNPQKGFHPHQAFGPREPSLPLEPERQGQGCAGLLRTRCSAGAPSGPQAPRPHEHRFSAFLKWLTSRLLTGRLSVPIFFCSFYFIPFPEFPEGKGISQASETMKP